MSLQDFIYYICSFHTKSSSSVGKERIVFILYLLSWKTSLSSVKSLPQFDWKHSDKGPASKMIDDAVYSDKRIRSQVEPNGSYGNERLTIIKHDEVSVAPDIKPSLDAICELTCKLSFKELTNVVYSTYPMLVSEVGSHLNLKELARKYRQLKEDSN